MADSNETTAQSASEATVACARCHAPMPVTAAFCTECGAENPLVCPKCQKMLPSPETRFCPVCGTKNKWIAAREAAEAQAKAKAEAAVAKARQEAEAAEFLAEVERLCAVGDVDGAYAQLLRVPSDKSAEVAARVQELEKELFPQTTPEKRRQAKRKKAKRIAAIVALSLVALFLLGWAATCALPALAKATAVSRLPSQMVDIPGAFFKLCKYEVTQALWEAVMGTNPSEFKGADRPVECVSWDDCQEFIKKLNALPEVKKSGLTYRLPTEEEWEYGCRAGSKGKYCKLADGREITERTLDRVAWYYDNSGHGTHPVGQKEPNAFGLYDMHGNVWEWTATAFGESRLPRGGSWLNGAGLCAAGGRNWYDPDYRNDYLGFRLAAED